MSMGIMVTVQPEIDLYWETYWYLGMISGMIVMCHDRGSCRISGKVSYERNAGKV